jgi:hypothetical protein
MLHINIFTCSVAMFFGHSHSVQMRLIVALIVAFALAAGLIFVTSDGPDGFKVLTDGSRAIFSFRDSNWDAVFGTISLREMNDKLNTVLGKVNTLEQDLNATRAELNELKVYRCFVQAVLIHSRSKISCKTKRLRAWRLNEQL